MTYLTNTRPEVHQGDTLTIRNRTTGYRETIEAGDVALIGHGDGLVLHVHQAVTNDIYDIDDDPEGWMLERVECPHPKTLLFSDAQAESQGCARCAWADWLTFPAVESGEPRFPEARQPADTTRQDTTAQDDPDTDDDGLTRYHEAVLDMLGTLMERYKSMKLDAGILLDDVRWRCERLYDAQHADELE